jgi:hypothetical protein
MDQQSAQRFEAWLAERGFEGERRRVRESPDGILVSKFGPGFAARLHDALDRVPELHDANGLAARYAATPAGTPRVEAWRLAVESLLAALGRERGLSRDQLSEVQAGVDSVAGLMDSVLWTSPTLGTEWTPSPAEASAYEEALDRMDDESSIFTRFYGEFEGTPVYNHCPGAQVARRLMGQAWAVVTGQG